MARLPEKLSEEAKELFRKVKTPKRRAFLRAFSRIGRYVKAAKAAKINLDCHYYWLKKDKAYAVAFELARQMAGDRAEDEVHRRAFEGWDHPVIHQGAITTHYKQPSDLLAIFHLKGLRPEKYRDSAPIYNIGPTQFTVSGPKPQSLQPPVKVEPPAIDVTPNQQGTDESTE